MVPVIVCRVLQAAMRPPRDRQLAPLVLMAAIHLAQDHRLVRMPHLVVLVGTAQVIYVPSAHTVLMVMVLVGLALQAGTRLPLARCRASSAFLGTQQPVVLQLEQLLLLIATPVLWDITVHHKVV